MLQSWPIPGQLCVGLDPEPGRIPACLLSEDNPIWAFNKAIVDATRPYAAAYKPNLAFYMAAGNRGWEALELTCAYAAPTPVILDGKFGDIGNTMDKYYQTAFTGLKTTAITANPLMGDDVLSGLDKYPGKMAFVLTLTSNPSAARFLKDNLAPSIAAWIAEKPMQLGAVVGATNSDDLATMRAAMPDTLFLVPGVGAQGGDLAAVIHKAAAKGADPRLLINSSRGIIFAGSGFDFAEAAAREAQKLQQQITTLLTER